jgi:DNA topoisomerase-3
MQQHPLSSTVPAGERCALQGTVGVTRHDHHFLQGAFGLVELPAVYGLTQCLPVALFDTLIDIFCSEDMEPLHYMLTSLSKRVGSLILLLDCYREGEAINNEAWMVCLKSNPRLVPRIYRAKFLTVLPQEIQRALQSFCSSGAGEE